MEAAMDEEQAVRRIRRLSRRMKPIPTGRRPSLRILSGLRAVLFDVYGTLFISASGDIGSAGWEARIRALGRSLRELGVAAAAGTAERAAALLRDSITKAHGEQKARGREHPEIEIREIFAGVLERLWSEGRLARQPDRALAEALALEYECRINPTWPMPGLRDTLEGLRARRLHLGIVSNAQFFTPLLFAALLGATPERLGFDPRLCAWSYTALEAKPSVRLFAKVVGNLHESGIAAGQVLYVGNDRLNDIWPASRLGFKTALFAGDSRSYRPRTGDPRLKGLEEELLITELLQLLEAIP
jgi:putative hydrolase of the HAD superfamily